MLHQPKSESSIPSIENTEQPIFTADRQHGHFLYIDIQSKNKSSYTMSEKQLFLDVLCELPCLDHTDKKKKKKTASSDSSI